jgi:hypothetical protein
MICLFSPMGAEETACGGKRSPWPSSASQTILNPPNSPCSSMPAKQLPATGKPDSYSKPGPGSAETHWKQSSAMHHRGNRLRRRRHPHALRTKTADHPTCLTPGHHPPRRQFLHGRRLSQHPPTPGPPRHPLEPRWTHRPGQSDHPVLVPPPGRRPSTRLPTLPAPRPRTNPIPAHQPGATGRVAADPYRFDQAIIRG